MKNKEMDPVVSVIMPVYEDWEYVDEALTSLFNQTFPHWECIVIDDGSRGTDVERFIEKYKNDTRIRFEKRLHQGLPAARNAGILLARGKYLQFLDADDKLENEKLERQIQFLETSPELDIIYGDVKYFGDKRKNGPKEVTSVLNSNILLKTLVHGNIAPVNCFLMRRLLTERGLLFDEVLPSYEDWDFWLRAARMNARFFYLKETFASSCVRLRKGSMICDKKNMLKGRIEVRKKINAEVESQQLLVTNRTLMILDCMRLIKAHVAPVAVLQ